MKMKNKFATETERQTLPPIARTALIFFCCFVGMASHSSAAEPLKKSPSNKSSRVAETIHPTSRFRHPGIFHSKAILDETRSLLANGDQLRLSAWNNMLDDRCGRFENWEKFRIAKREIIGYDNSGLAMAAGMANSFALQWILTGDAKYANAATDIIREWSNTLTLIQAKPDDRHQHNRLLAGIHCGHWANAGELLRSSGASWPKKDQKQFEDLLRNVFLPAMEPRPNHFNGNWDLACTKSTLAIAVFLDDRPLFDENIERLKHGATNGSITNYLLVSGQCQESGRDQTHAQMGLDFLAQASEIAWNQGIDLYEYEGRSVGRCFEYLAQYNLGDDNVPFEVYSSPVGRNAHDQATAVSAQKRGKWQPIFEKVYYHYQVRKGQHLPFVAKALEKTRPEKTDAWNTLTFGLPIDE